MKYKTIFIDAPLVKEKKPLSTTLYEVNGDQFARDIDAAILEKEKEGFELISSTPVFSSKHVMGTFAYGYTTGVLLTFKK